MNRDFWWLLCLYALCLLPLHTLLNVLLEQTRFPIIPLPSALGLPLLISQMPSLLLGPQNIRDKMFLVALGT